MKAPTHHGLTRFAEESNAIEGIVRKATSTELDALNDLLELSELTHFDVVRYVRAVCGASLRERPGMDVRIGNHRPIPGGPKVAYQLHALLARVNNLEVSPYEAHCAYETLHAFLDGNGRSGRAIWAWHMRKLGFDPFRISFLQCFYYQSLDACDARKEHPG